MKYPLVIFLTFVFSVYGTSVLFATVDHFTVPWTFEDSHGNTSGIPQAFIISDNNASWKTKYEDAESEIAVLNHVNKDIPTSTCVVLKPIAGSTLTLNYKGSLYLMMDNSTISTSTLDFNGNTDTYSGLYLLGSRGEFVGDNMNWFNDGKVGMTAISPNK